LPAQPRTLFPTAPDGAALGLEDVRYEKRGARATVTIARPKVLNAIATRTLRDLARAFEDAAWDDAIAVVVLTGEGTRSFCSGADVREYRDAFLTRPRDYWKYLGDFARAIEAILGCGKPVVARLNGAATGGGHELALACDLAVAAEHATVGQVGTAVGSVAALGATQWLPLVAGDRRAREMLYLCEPVDARTAERWGLVNRVVPSVAREGELLGRDALPDEIERAKKGDGFSIDLGPLDRAIDELCAKLEDRFDACTRYTRAQVNAAKRRVWSETLEHAKDWLALHKMTPEAREGFLSFLEKRPADRRGLRARSASGQDDADFEHGPPLRTCPACDTTRLPARLPYCGNCGARLDP
jgi:enoyl-CoA hydratase/carnithine racemase